MPKLSLPKQGAPAPIRWRSWTSQVTTIWSDNLDLGRCIPTPPKHAAVEPGFQSWAFPLPTKEGPNQKVHKHYCQSDNINVKIVHISDIHETKGNYKT